MNAPETVEPWEKSFAGPLAITRQTEKQLRNDIAAGKERLRTLVGASYRDLLETAERIVHLDGQMQKTVQLLGDTSLRCSLDVVNQKAAALSDSYQQRSQREQGGHQLLAQLGLLDRCSRCLPRISRRGGSFLTAAKVLALSRVLNKSISQGDEAPPVLSPIREQLSSERGRLLARIDVQLTRPGSHFQQLVDAVCAFCITTSSSSTDGIRHLQDLRLAEIKQLLDSSEKLSENYFSAFEYYLSSLQMIRKLLGRPLSDAFRELQNQPVLQAPDVSALPDLALESVRDFLPREILNFVPFLKHQDASQSQLLSALSEWSQTSFKDLTAGLAHAVTAVRKPADILDFREIVMKIWLPVSASAPVYSRDEIFTILRSKINDHLHEMIREETTSLNTIAKKVGRASRKSSTTKASFKLWDEGFLNAPLGDGCVSFKQGLIDRHLGQSDSSHRITSSMQRWTQKIAATTERIQKLRKRRWIDVIEEDDADDERAPSIEKDLQTVDPESFLKAQSLALQTTLRAFQTSLQALTTSLSPSSPVQAVIFLLRTIRTIHHLLTISPLTQPLDLSILLTIPNHLHRLLATHISQTLPKTGSPRPSATQAHLWTGSPLLPTLPSPQAYRFLQFLTRAMEDAGTDLWCPEAVGTVKRTVAEKFGHLSSLIVVDGGEVANGIKEGKDGPDGADVALGSDVDRIGVVQAVFDGLYLLEALKERSNGPEDIEVEEAKEAKGLIELVERAKKRWRALDSDEANEGWEMLQQRAQASWTRTALLFGLLA